MIKWSINEFFYTSLHKMGIEFPGHLSHQLYGPGPNICASGNMTEADLEIILELIM
jgi:hypothetical protein